MDTTQQPFVGSKRIAFGCALLLGMVVLGVGTCNPFVGPFLSTFRVQNNSGQPIWITPIGMWEGSGRIGPLPLYHSSAFILRDTRVAKRKVLPGESIEFTYDMDDINFRHILVRNLAGEVRILDTDRKGSIGLCYGAQHSSYSVPQLRSLRLAPEQLRECESGDDVDYPPLRINYEN